MTAKGSHPPGAERSRPVQGLVLAGLVVLALGVGAAGALVTAPAIETWYEGLDKPWFTPPGAAFGPVWTVLYVAMAVAAWRIWRAAPLDETASPLSLWGAQLALNAAWSPAFFGLRSPGFGLVVIAGLLAVVALTIHAFRRIDRAATYLMGAYLVWVAYAAALNAAIWWTNGG